MNNCLFFAIYYRLTHKGSTLHYENNSRRSKWIRWMIMGHFYVLDNNKKISYKPYKKPLLPIWFKGYVEEKFMN